MKFKFFVLSLFVMFLAVPGFSQEWLTDYDTAMAQATNENKHVLVFFTGSDWCPPCKRIKKNLYNSDTFKEYAKENLVLVIADFPKRKENKLSPEQEAKNRALAKVFNPRGFPTTIILDTSGDELNRWVGYDPAGAESYIQQFKEITSL
jgi:thioredoxin-related protein